jgi:hypothetical protein
MARDHIRTHKKTVARGLGEHANSSDEVLARESALALLERSISFRHDRLAIIRLSIAVSVGADVPASHWSYCEEAFRRSCDPGLVAMLQAARDAADARLPRIQQHCVAP